MPCGVARQPVALQPRGLPWSLSRILGRTERRVSRFAQERRDNYTPLIMAAYKDSGLMRYLKEEGLY